jgi:ABC-type multidrug transport system fused ATPase/permease subunit
MPSVIKHYNDNMRISLQAGSRCLSYRKSGLFSFLGLTWWLASALGQTRRASFAFAFALTATAALLTAAAALLSSLLILLAASAAFLASAWAVALVLGAGFQFLAVVNDPDVLAFDGGLRHCQSGLLSAGRAAGRFGRLAGAGRR